MARSFFKLSVRKWIFLAWPLTALICFGISALAQELFYEASLRPSPALPLPAGFPTSTIYARVNDWVKAGGGPVPANLSNAVEVYPEYIAVCLIVINRDQVPSSEKERIAQITGLTSARDSADELDKFIPGDKSIAKLRTTFNLRTFDEQAKIAKSVIADELRVVDGYPSKPQPQPIEPNLAQNQP